MLIRDNIVAYTTEISNKHEHADDDSSDDDTPSSTATEPDSSVTEDELISHQADVDVIIDSEKDNTDIAEEKNSDNNGDIAIDAPVEPSDGEDAEEDTEIYDDTDAQDIDADTVSEPLEDAGEESTYNSGDVDNIHISSISSILSECRARCSQLASTIQTKTSQTVDSDGVQPLEDAGEESTYNSGMLIIYTSLPLVVF